MKVCKYCREDIKDDAIKCKHCGSVLTEDKTMLPGASDIARGVLKASKDSVLHDQIKLAFGIVIAFISLVIGYLFNSWLIGLIAFILLAIPLNIWYYRE